MGAELTERLDAPEEDLRPYVLFAADRVFRVVLEALANIEGWEPWPPFGRGYHVNLSPTFSLTVGARGLTAGEGEEIWARLRRAPDLAAKLQFALWAAYFEAGGQPSSRVWTSLDSMVAMLGYAQHPSGGYLPRDLRLVAHTLEGVVGLAVSGRWAEPRSGKDHTITGPLWQEGLVVRERRDGGRERLWVAHQPGPWFADPLWAAKNRYLGHVSTALLELDARRERWTIRVGAAMTWLRRTNLGNGPLMMRVHALIDQTGAALACTSRPARLRAQVEAALDRLMEMGLLSRWEWLPGPSGAVGGWMAGSIRATWAEATPILDGSDTHPRRQRHPSSTAATPILNGSPRDRNPP